MSAHADKLPCYRYPMRCQSDGYFSIPLMKSIVFFILNLSAAGMMNGLTISYLPHVPLREIFDDLYRTLKCHDPSLASSGGHREHIVGETCQGAGRHTSCTTRDSALKVKQLLELLQLAPQQTHTRTHTFNH